MKRLIPSFIIGLSACTFTPEGENLVTISKTPPQTLVSLLHYKDNDTIAIYNPTTFQYTIETDKGNISSVKVLLNDKDYKTLYSSSGTFSIDNNMLTPQYGNYNVLATGYAVLKIMFDVSSGTGSLADKAGQEHYEVWHTWVLKVDVDPPPTPKLKFSNENGFLKISWDAFLKPNFLSYTLTSQETNTYNTYRIITISDAAHSYWIDSSYAGGYAVQYSIAVASTFKTSSAYSTYSTAQNFTIASYTADSTITLSWNKPKYESAFNYYVIQEEGRADSIVIHNVRDTLYTFKLKNVLLGKPSTISFSLRPKKKRYYIYPLLVAIAEPVLLPKLQGISSLESLTYNISLQKTVAVKGDASLLCIYNSSMQLVDSIYYPFNYSPPAGKYMYTSKNGDILQVNLTTREQKIIPIKSTPYYYAGAYNISGGDNQLVSYEVITKNSIINYQYIDKITDMSLSNTLYTKTTSRNFMYTPQYVEAANPLLSTDGQFALFHDKTLYKVEGGSFQLVGTLPGNLSWDGFRPENNAEILFKEGSPNYSLDIYDAATLSFKRSINSPVKGFGALCYDLGSKYVMFGPVYTSQNNGQGQDLYFVHVDTGDVKHIKAFSSTNNDIYYTLINGYLIKSPGYGYYKVPL